jgi:glycerol kinase
MSAVSPIAEDEFYIAAIDQGTSSSRVMVYDSKGQQVASHQVAIPHIKPKPGYVLHLLGIFINSNGNSASIISVLYIQINTGQCCH